MQSVTLPQARLLRRHYADMDGHREISQTLIAIVTSLFPPDPAAAPPPTASTRPTPPRAPVPDEAGVMIPELVNALKWVTEKQSAESQSAAQSAEK